MKTSTVMLTIETINKLKKLKKHPRESYEEVIKRLI